MGIDRRAYDWGGTGKDPYWRLRKLSAVALAVPLGLIAKPLSATFRESGPHTPIHARFGSSSANICDEGIGPHVSRMDIEHTFVCTTYLLFCTRRRRYR